MRKSTLVLVILLSSICLAHGQETLSQGWNNLYFQSGLDFLAHRQHGAAYDAFGDFLSNRSLRDPRGAEAEYYRAYCALNLYHADGEKAMEQYVAKYPDNAKAVYAYYDLACFFYTEKDYGKAGVYFASVNFPSLSDELQNSGRFRWGYSLFSQRNLLAALDQFNIIKALGGQYGPASSYYAGFIESSIGDYDNALIDLERAQTNPSYANIVPILIASVYFKQGNDDGLLKYTEAILETEELSSPDEISLLMAEAWFRKGAYRKALPRYKVYLKDHEDASRQVIYRAGYSALTLGEDELALSLLKRSASDIDSVGMYASYLLGSLYLKRQDKQLALTAFETARKFRQDPRLSEESHFMSAKLNYDLGRPDIAISEFEQVLAKYPQSSHTIEIKELLSQAYVNANNYNKAIEYIESIPHRTPAVDRAYQKATYLKGTELFNKEVYAQAAVLFEKSLEFPIDVLVVAEASYWFGETYSLGRKYELAIPQYELALANTPQNTELIRQIRYGLGYAQYNLQKYDRAIVSFKDYVSKASPSEINYTDGILRLADCQYIIKAYAEAIALYRQVIHLNSVDSDYAHLQLGLIFAIQRHYGEAAIEFEDVAKNSSSRYSEDALFQLGQLDFERGNYVLAINHFTRLINSAKTARSVPYALSLRAAAYYNLKQYDQTADDYIAVVTKFPTHPVVQDLLLPLQESLTLANRSAEFDQYLNQFKNANPDAKGIEGVEFDSAKSLYFNQNYSKAIETLSKFTVNYPESPHLSEAKYYEAESYYRLKDFSRCLEIYKQVARDDTFVLISKVIARVAELEYKQQNFDSAVEAFYMLAKLATNKKEEYTALNGLMESYYLLAQYDSAEGYARRIQQQGNINASAQSKASLYLGKSAMARGDYETAKDEFLATFNSAQDEYGAEAKYLLAEIFFLNGEHKQCYETLISLNSDFSAYEDWVGKSYLLLADNYVPMGNVFHAKATLKSLIENFPKQDVRDLAKEKLKGIEAAELKKSATVKSDTTENEK